VFNYLKINIKKLRCIIMPRSIALMAVVCLSVCLYRACPSPKWPILCRVGR